MSFEDDLRAALRRESPSPDFAARVLAKADESDRVTIFPVWRRLAIWALAAGIAVAVVIPSAVIEFRRHREIERGLEAKRELVMALQITRTKLQQTRERVRRATAKHIL